VLNVAAGRFVVGARQLLSARGVGLFGVGPDELIQIGVGDPSHELERARGRLGARRVPAREFGHGARDEPRDFQLRQRGQSQRDQPRAEGQPFTLACG